MTKKEIPVLLLTGYLGSGKTTLLNRILKNEQGLKFAVIVNDIGEVNIDADLIEQGGVVGKKDESLVALQNGCICCTLKMDLVAQLKEIVEMGRFDYIVIEASGICEPAPIAQTICSIPQMGGEVMTGAVPVLDCIVSVVDALRLQSEFRCGEDLQKKDLGEEDLENLVIQQIEFCNIVLLNKASEVSEQERSRIKQIIRAIQPKAEIIECDYGDVPLEKIVGTGMFDFEAVATSATWVHEVESLHDEHEHEDDDDDDDDHECHCHHHHDDDDDEHECHCHHHHDDDDDDHECHCHHHDHDDDDDDDEHECHCHHHHHHHHHDGEGEAEEYGIGTYVYFRRRPFDQLRFEEFATKHWPKNVIRAKGMCYFTNNRDMCYVFEQAGVQKSLREAGLWYATMPEDELAMLLRQNPQIAAEWDEKEGDRMQKLVFIGQHLDKQAIAKALDECLM